MGSIRSIESAWIRLLIPLVAVGTWLILAGCSTGIQVTRVMTDTPQVGNPWNLGMTTFKVTITRQVVGCTNGLVANVDVMATPELILDKNQRYVLESNGWWATSDIASELTASGISTGLNASSADASVGVIANTVGTIAKTVIGKAAGGAGGAAAAAFNGCSGDVAKAVASLYPEGAGSVSLKKQVEQKTKALSDATAALSLLVQQAKFNKKLRAKVIKALAVQDTAQSQLADITEDLATKMALTTDIQTVTWPFDASEFITVPPFSIDPKVIKKWKSPQLDSKTAVNDFDVYLAISKSRTSGVLQMPSTPAAGKTSTGVPVRLAQTGQLLACNKAGCLNDPVIPIAKEFTILQLGQLYTVPLTGGSFRSQNATIKMDQHGLPTSIQVVEKVAAAEALTAAVHGVGTQAAALPAQIRAAELDNTTAQANQIKADSALAMAGIANATAAQQAQLARVNAGNELAAALARSGSQSETASLLSQAQLWNAKGDLAAAQLKAGLPVATAGLLAQTLYLNAQDTLKVTQANQAVVDETSLLGSQTALFNAQTARINAIVARQKADAEVLTP
ncbi:hypothetical protein JAB6_11100 [Janthinobacterium sp. HH104]|nr:hypothetical protein JAB6_11100 [Janthinobacterium sp. HH104]